MSYTRIISLLTKTKSKLTVKEFQEKINVVFHDFEANYYDDLHKDMWESLQQQFDLLVQDGLQYITHRTNLKVLDIGCGTGLSSELLLNTKIKPYVQQVTLLDTSPNMLKFAQKKAETWNVNYQVINGNITQITELYDVIVISSVLHHIPDLTTFLHDVSQKLNPNGLLIHLQDPNSDFLKTEDYTKRVDDFKKQNPKLIPNNTNIFFKKIKRFIKRLLNRKDYIDLINDELIRQNVIQKRMTADELWSVTDIQIASNVNDEINGISLHFLKHTLKDFTLLSTRSYGFFGVLKHDLPSNFKEIEEQLIQEKSLFGRNLACIWQKNQ